MPYGANFLRHTLVWDLPGGETAMSSCAWVKPVDRDYDPPLTDATADELGDRGLGMWGLMLNRYAGGVRYRGSKVSIISPAGLTLATLERFVSPIPGENVSNTLPHEVAVVASLRTSIAGRSARGRMYLPPPAANTLTDQGRLNGDSREDIATAMAAYLGAMPSGLVSVVASATTGFFLDVTQVKVGDVYDAQRRRRNRLNEVWTDEDV